MSRKRYLGRGGGRYASNSNIAIIKLLENDNCVNACNIFYKSPVFSDGSRNDTIELIKLLLRNGSDVNNTDSRGQTALFCARSKEIAQILVNNGADVNCIDKAGNSPIFYAVKEDCLGKVQLLIDNGADVTNRDNSGSTALCYTRSEEIIRLLLDNGIDVNSECENGITPILQASTYSIDIVRLLIRYGADVNCKDRDGNSPIFFAVEKNYSEMVQLLIDNGADINCKNSNGNAPVSEAILSNNLGQVQILVKNGADINCENKKGDSPINLALTINDEITEFLIQNGAEINSRFIEEVKRLEEEKIAYDRERKIAPTETKGGGQFSKFSAKYVIIGLLSSHLHRYILPHNHRPETLPNSKVVPIFFFFLLQVVTPLSFLPFFFFVTSVTSLY